MENEILELYAKYLSQTYALMEMVKCIQHKTLNLRLVRDEKKLWIKHLLCYNYDLLVKIIDRFELKKEPRNFYLSVADFSRIPIITWNLRGRKDTVEYAEFEKNLDNLIIAFDFLMDFDGKKDYSKCYEETKFTLNLLQEYKVPYYIIPSSLTGFQIVIPSSYLPKKPIKELRENIMDILKNIVVIYDFKCLDLSPHDNRKLRKLPFSPTIDGAVCIPLSDEDFKYSLGSTDMFKIGNVLKNLTIKNRGLKIRTYGLSDEQLKENLIKFWGEFLK